MEIKYSNTNKRLIVGICLTILVVTPVIISFIWMPFDPNEVDYSSKFLPPSFYHLFGTDDYGRDIYCRLMRGAGITFGISLFTVLTGAVIGTFIGALTGYFGGIVDEVLMRINDCLSSFPSILLALVVVSLLDKGTLNICIALTLVFIPSFSRIMRSEFMSEKNKDYVLNARLMGAGHFRVIFVHILPNTLPILFSTMLVGLNNAVLAEAGLSYLGLGVQPPEPSLGRMLSEAKVYLWSAPWYEICTCLVIIILILGITTVSENVGVSGISFRRVRRKIAEKRRNEEYLKNTEKSDKKKNSESTGAEETADKKKNSESIGAEETADKNGENERLHDKENRKNQKNNILTVQNLDVGFIDENGIKQILNNVSFELKNGEILGVVGESGSGKSLTALSIMGLLPENAALLGGSISYDGRTLTDIHEDEYRRLRGRDIAFVFQEPMTSLNPVVRVGTQIDEVLDIHFSQIPEAEQKKIVLEALEDVGLQNPDELYNMYPHELSGGMRQRVMIAMALVAKSRIIIADEPTTALDADVAGVILDLFEKINRKYGTSIILISHDLRVIGRISDRAMIMQNGRIVEIVDIHKERNETYYMVVKNPAFQKSKPARNGDGKKKVTKNRKSGDESMTINEINSLSDNVQETERAEKIIKKECFDLPVTEYGRRLLEAAFAGNSLLTPGRAEESMVRMKNVNVFYRSRDRKSNGLRQVIFNAELDIRKGDTAGIVGESGCGKTTLVKAMAGLQKYMNGEVKLECERPGMVFQDPYSSLNPAFTVERILEEPLRIANRHIKKEKRLKKEEIKKKVLEILDSIELDSDIAERRVTNLSGGQRQRIAIALTIILKRELIILDEPVSALDVTIQEQILKLLTKLKKQYGLTYVIISHDRRLVARLCNVVYSVEKGIVKEVLSPKM